MRKGTTNINSNARRRSLPPPPPLWFNIITWHIISASIHSPFFCEQLAGNSFRSATRVTTRTKQHITNQVRTRSAIASKFNNHTKPAPFSPIPHYIIRALTDAAHISFQSALFPILHLYSSHPTRGLLTQSARENPACVLCDQQKMFALHTTLTPHAVCI